MDLNVFVGKNYEEILEEALKQLNLTEDDVIVSKKEKKKGLFKSTELELTVTPPKDIMEYVKEYLSNVLKKMGLDINFESQRMKMYIWEFNGWKCKFEKLKGENINLES